MGKQKKESKSKTSRVDPIYSHAMVSSATEDDPSAAASSSSSTVTAPVSGSSSVPPIINKVWLLLDSFLLCSALLCSALLCSARGLIPTLSLSPSDSWTPWMRPSGSGPVLLSPIWFWSRTLCAC